VKIEIGQLWNWKGILGKIVHQDGGTFYFSTPHGTVWKMGFVHLGRDLSPLTPEERKTLAEYTVDARRNNGRAYVRPEEIPL